MAFLLARSPLSSVIVEERTGAARMFAISTNHTKDTCQDIYIPILWLWSSNFRLGRKQPKKEQKNKRRKRRKKNFRDCGVLRIVSQSFAGSVAGLTKPPRFVWSTMYGVHRIPVFLAEYWKTERIDRKEGKKAILPIVRSSFLFRSIYRKYVKVGYFLACMLLRLFKIRIAPYKQYNLNGQRS